MCLEVIWIVAARAWFEANWLESSAKFMRRSLGAFKKWNRTSDFRPCQEISEARSLRSDG
jgi:hypothetical protein